MSTDILKVPKLKQQVSLWVHPEGQVIGSLFVREQSPEHAGPETASEVLNQDGKICLLLCQVGLSPKNACNPPSPIRPI